MRGSGDRFQLSLSVGKQHIVNNQSSLIFTPLVVTAFVIILLSLAACSDRSEQDMSPTTQAHAPPPPELLDALWQGVDDGVWTIEEALIAHLQSLADNRDLQELYDKPTETEELTALIATARHYVAIGDDPDARERIRQLLDQLTGSPEILRALSAPEPVNGAWLNWPSWMDVIGKAYAMSALCERAVRNAYPASVTDIGDPCFHYREHRNRHGTHVLYYPARWTDDRDPRLDYVGYAQQAIDDALDAYNPLGSLEPVDIVFTEGSMGGTYAFVDLGEFHLRESDDDYCLIHVLQLSYDELSANDFRQAMAHEIFHCFQSWNFPRQTWGDGSGLRWQNITLWWSEGMAEYFSNVVYPHNDFEWRKIGHFDARSPDTPIHHLSYENFLFFQYLGNRFGNSGVIELLRTLPTSGGRDEQGAALANFRDMQTVLHEFGQSYLDRDIRDTGDERPIPVNPDPGERHEIDAPEFTIETDPLVVHRVQLVFPGTAPKEVIVEEEGTPGRNQVKEGEEAHWRDLPSQVGTGLSVCQAEEREYQLLMTAAAGGNEKYTVRLNLEDLTEGGEDLENAAYRYRNFAGALKLMQEHGPDIFVPPAKSGVSAGDRAKVHDIKEPLHCYMVCSLRCICNHPEMHSSRVATEDECYRYHRDGRKTIRYAGETYTECERMLYKVEPQYRPKAFGLMENWCMLGCRDTCGWPP